MPIFSTQQAQQTQLVTNPSAQPAGALVHVPVQSKDRTLATHGDEHKAKEFVWPAQADQPLDEVAWLRQAIAQGELVLHFQPQISLSSGEMVGVGALAYWQDLQRGPVLACDFEDAEARLLINEWVLRTAFLQAARWSAAGLKLGCVSANLSAGQLLQTDVVRQVQAVLLESGVDPRLIGIEVSENVLMHDDFQHVTSALSELKALGVRILLDDFGAGYSSLSHLHNLPIDLVKIDQSFIQNVTASTRSASITRSIIQMAHSVEVKVLAKGVQTEEQLKLLADNHCEFMQGTYFSGAVPAAGIEVMLRQGSCLPPAVLGAKASRRTLLLVDDEENIVSALRRALRRDNYHIVTAHSGAEGLQRLSENDVSVIVSDQRMPGMTGVDFLRVAKERHPATVRIVLSGYTELKSITDAINEGAIYKFLTKPWDDDQLREHIAEAFRHRELPNENNRLTSELKAANQELDQANRRLQVLLAAQSEKIQHDQARLVTVYELLEGIPVPMIGLDIEGFVAFVNSAAEQVIAPAAHLIGLPAAQVLSGKLLMAAAPGGSQSLLIGDQSFRVLCRDMGVGQGARGQVLMLLP